ncbi:hypothetical protein LRP52_45215 [Photobacterium sp. ZSDE20]|nr:hypothetical protein [Photobacterium sp. ZSDE20]
MHLYIGNLALAPALSKHEYNIDIEDLSNWRANWLSSDFNAHIWHLTNYKTPINFNARLVNGELLTAPKYSTLLNTIKKIVFLKRSGHLADIGGKQATRSQVQYSLARDLISIAQYLVNNDLHTEGLGFASMTKTVFDDFIKLFVLRGRDGVSGHLDIVRNELEKLRSAGNLGSINDNKGVFSPSKFTDATGVDSEIVNYLSAISKDSLREYCQFREHAKSVGGVKPEYNNATPLKESRQESGNSANGSDDEVTWKISDSRIAALVSAVNTLSDFQIPLKTAELASFRAFEVTIKDYEMWCYESRRTANIPTASALAYIDSAVEFVHRHGENLVATLKDCKEQIDNEVASRAKPRKDHVMKRILVPKNCTTLHFDVHRFNALKTGSSAAEKRDDVTVEILLEVFQTSVFILLTTFACKRFNDVMPVIHGANTIGFTGLNFVKFGLSKSDPSEILRTVGRPVPEVVADAFDNLIEINNILLGQSDEPTTHLFQAELSFPSSLSSTQDRLISREILIRRLVNFADFVEIPTVNVGGVESRWYLNRMHMLRRFFACAYYHTNDKQGIPALTWLMGHTDTIQTMHYVTQNLSNAEMTSAEAANVIANKLNDSDEEKDFVQMLSELFGEPTQEVTIARNPARLEKRINELIARGYRVVRKVSGELVLLNSLPNQEDVSHAA